MRANQYKSKYKWKKHKILMGKNEFLSLLPETRLLSYENFWTMLKRYGTIVIKPDNGEKGKGIYRISSLLEKNYKIRFEDQERSFTEVSEVDKFIQKVTSHTQYLVQQWIDLATIKERPFDIRMTVQQNPKKQWVVTGCLAKVAAEENFVTNVSSGGEMLRLEKALGIANYPGPNPKIMLEKLRQRALDIAKAVGPHYQRFKAAGIDFGIDKKGHLWFFEINYKPAFYVWEELDPPMYKKMMRLKNYWEKRKVKDKAKNKTETKNKTQNKTKINKTKNKTKKAPQP